MPRQTNEVESVNTGTVPQNPDVETITTDEGEEVAGTPEASADAPKEPKAKKEPARGDLPEGYVTPVGLAKVLGEKGLQSDKDGNVLSTVAPQMVYSYIKNASKDDPFPTETVTDSLGHERNAMQLTKAIEWWERKNARAAERKANAKVKADKAAEKAASKESSTADGDEPAGEVVEAE